MTEPIAYGLRKQGPGSLFIDAPIDAWFFNIDGGLADIRHPGPHTLNYTRTYAGTLLITNNAVVTVAKPTLPFTTEGNLYLGDRSGDTSLSNRIGGTASVSMPDIGYNVRQQYFIVGQNGRATLDITDDALLSATLYAGRSSTAAGAIYQSGNSVVTNTTGAANDGGLGTASGAYGYYGLESGFNHTKGYWQVAQAQYSQGILRQTGGSFTMPGGGAPASGAVGDYYGWHRHPHPRRLTASPSCSAARFTTVPPWASAVTATAAPTPAPARSSSPARRTPRSTGPLTSGGATVMPMPETAFPTSCSPATGVSRRTASMPPTIPAGKASASTAAPSSARTPNSKSSTGRLPATTSSSTKAASRWKSRLPSVRLSMSPCALRPG
ncbi:MAG: hypothetical protein ACOX7Q_05760 [Kiritimatiellia bacterium]